MSFLDFGRFFVGSVRKRPSNRVSLRQSKEVCEWLLGFERLSCDTVLQCVLGQQQELLTLETPNVV